MKIFFLSFFLFVGVELATCLVEQGFLRGVVVMYLSLQLSSEGDTEGSRFERQSRRILFGVIYHGGDCGFNYVIPPQASLRFWSHNFPNSRSRHQGHDSASVLPAAGGCLRRR